MSISTTRIDGGMTISEIKEEVKLSERIKREEINLIHRLESQLTESRAIVTKMEIEIKDYTSEIREIDRYDKKHRIGRYEEV